MDIGTVRQVDIDDQMRSAYLDYAMSVIVARALPDARDGLKPVHRRILYAMHDMGIRSNTPYRKSARIVGEVLGKYHPHGDSAVYDAMARMAQDFSMRYLLVDGQGNFGSIDGDAPAAMRYTEARTTRMAEEILLDIEQNTVDFSENFDGSLEEPAVLPSRIPNLLLNGSAGIAVGMATNVPPHNLGELVAALSYMIDNYDQIDEVSVEDLLEYLPGPDFPTGGVIVGDSGIRQAYSTGRGRIVLRGMAVIEEMKGGRFRIVITEIPYQLNKNTLIERIADLARSGRIGDISDLRDESDRRGMSIIVELKRTAQPRKVLNQLYKFTPLQSTYGAQMLALVDGEPRLLSLKRALRHFIDHRKTVVVRRTRQRVANDPVDDQLCICVWQIMYEDGDIELLRDTELVCGYRRHLLGRDGHSDIGAVAVKSAGAYEGPSPIAAGPGKHDHHLPRRIPQQETLPGEMCQVATGVLHHLYQVDFEVLDHRPIDLDHLFRGQIGNVALQPWNRHHNLRSCR